MTVAVCLHCGAMKFGAWTPCLKCGHLPELPEDKARQVMVTDHFLGQTDLKAISERIQSGQPIHFDPQQVKEFAATMEDLPLAIPPVSETKPRRLLFPVLVLIVAIALALWMILR